MTCKSGGIHALTSTHLGHEFIKPRCLNASRVLLFKRSGWISFTCPGWVGGFHMFFQLEVQSKLDVNIVTFVHTTKSWPLITSRWTIQHNSGWPRTSFHQTFRFFTKTEKVAPQNFWENVMSNHFKSDQNFKNRTDYVYQNIKLYWY